jgi:hypothetical protein
VNGDTLLTVNETGLIQLVHFDDEQGELKDTFHLEDQILASPAIAGGGVFLRSNSRLWKIVDAKQ